MPPTTPQASRPANIQPMHSRLLRGNRNALIVLSFVTIGAISSAILLATGGAKSKRPATGGIVLAAVAASTIKANRTRFQQGMLLPGVIISEKPLLYATLADMSRTDDARAFDVLAVRSCPRWIFPAGAQPKVGDRIPVCALYHSPPYITGRPAHWDQLLPEPAHLATTDENVIADAAARIPAQEWLALDAALKQPQAALVHNATFRVDVSTYTNIPTAWPADTIGKPTKKCKPVTA